MFGFGKRRNYIDTLLAKKDVTLFVAGIQDDPKRFFAEAGENPPKTIRALASLLDLAHHSIGQTAVLLSINGAMKVAAKDKRAPKDASALAEKLSSELMRIFKLAGS